ncbi:hypothetical protein B0H34DRAFT_383997 [Crassisporium funariophilum]|nr:hypothetical protein B0H34DRAFT_383997 [Crassisporium funariophilum]
MTEEPALAQGDCSASVHPDGEVQDPLLPVELWLKIFLMLINSRISSASCFGRKQAPLLLTWVCQHWRNIVINVPDLWTTMHLYMNEKADLRANQTPLFRLWNDRTKGKPLQIFLRDLSRPHKQSRGYSNSLPRSFFNGSRRWETLHLTIKLAPNSLYRLYGIKGKLDILESFTLLYTERSGSAFNSDGSQTPDLLEGTPNLRSISLLKTKQFFDLQIDFHNLLQVDLAPKSFLLEHSLTLYNCLRVLRMCRNLERARFNCGPVDEDEPPSQPKLIHQKLRDLTIIEAEAFDMGAFLDVLDVPSLIRLSIASYFQTPSSWNQAALTDFLSRTAGSIRRLELHLPHKVDLSLTHLQCLRLCPRIEQFLFMMDGSKHTKDDILADGFPRRALSWPESLPSLYYWANSKESSFTICSNPHRNMGSMKGGCLRRKDYVS